MLQIRPLASLHHTHTPTSLTICQLDAHFTICLGGLEFNCTTTTCFISKMLKKKFLTPNYKEFSPMQYGLCLKCCSDWIKQKSWGWGWIKSRKKESAECSSRLFKWTAYRVKHVWSSSCSFISVRLVVVNFEDVAMIENMKHAMLEPFFYLKCCTVLWYL